MSDEGKLFIGGLSFDTNEESLGAAFGKYGSIEKVDVIRDTETGKSRGFGFVKFGNSDDAKDAQEAMNGQTLDGRSIRVDEAGKGGRSRGGFSSGGSRGGQRGGGYNGDRGYGDRSYGDRSFHSEGRYGGGGGGGQYRNSRGGGGGGGSGYSSYRDNSYAGNE